jgi:DnaT-like ssDNA binding protein
MSVTIISTVGADDANSYVTLEEAQAILAGRTDAADFLAESDDEQSALLILATEWLQRRAWRGVRVDDDQRLAFPRRHLLKPDSPSGAYFDIDAIPEAVQLAECELALGFYSQDDLESSSSGGDGITSFTAGRISVQYGAGGSSSASSESQYLTRTRQLLRGLLAHARVERA